MKHKRIRIVIAGLAAFDALTAIGGGVAMLVGADRFPPEWLQTTPFSDYTVPALVLALAVGGSSLIAAGTIMTRREVGVFAALAAGSLMAAYQLVEIAMLNDDVLLSWIEALYFGLGLTIAALAGYLWLAENRGPYHTGHFRHS
jgi:hypothetical protein